MKFFYPPRAFTSQNAVHHLPFQTARLSQPLLSHILKLAGSPLGGVLWPVGGPELQLLINEDIKPIISKNIIIPIKINFTVSNRKTSIIVNVSLYNSIIFSLINKM